MKRWIAILLTVVMLMSLVACAHDPEGAQTDSATDGAESISESETETELESDSETDTETDTETETGADTEPEEESGYVPGYGFENAPTAAYPTAEVPKTLRVLSIGNSFSDDAMEYLYGIAKSAGVETVILGNLYIGGCTLATHLSNAKSGAKSYIYRKNTTGTWVSTEKSSFDDGLLDEEWDYITLQQASQNSGVSSTYGALAELVSIVNARKINKNAKLFWHMTWAYQQNSTHSGFANYNQDQATMYNSIVRTVLSTVVPTGLFAGVIPSGTTVQNARTSFMGDTLTRDGYHMNYTKGRYMVGLTYFAALTGADVSKIGYVPSADINAEVMAVAKESVTNAMRAPYAVYRSTYKTGNLIEGTDRTVVNAEDCREMDAVFAAMIGVDLSRYVLLEYDYLTNTYYNSTARIGTETPSSSASTSRKFICTAKRYTKEQLMNAVIICDYGWQYRPELWPDETSLPSKRGNNTSVAAKVLDEAFWGNYTVFAMNISSSPQTVIDDCYDAAASHVRIYVSIELLEELEE